LIAGKHTILSQTPGLTAFNHMTRRKERELLANFRTVFLFLLMIDLVFVALADDYPFTIFRIFGILFLSVFNAVVLFTFDSLRRRNYDPRIWSFTPTYILVLSSFAVNVPDKESILGLLVLVAFSLSNYLRLRRMTYYSMKR